ncbi:snapalysin [Streptomyces sp. CA-294286]|uniref:snapalysin n=1 Tax=Streptomyces sp. CA-294286 TaxID=3240070 RepID=UPI003D9428E5
MRFSRIPRALLATALGLGVATVGAVPVANASAANTVSAPVSSYVAYDQSKENAAATKAFQQAVWKEVAKQRAANPGIQVVTVRYNASSAPSFRTQIARSTQIWNSSVSNVRLQESTSGASFSYREGNDSRGSYASTDGHGRGFIFLDYRQNQIYNSTRVTSHETGHVLGLPDRYSGPCSELMSGGGPGPSCTNAVPDARERARVNQLWANGFNAAVAATR